MRLKMLGSFCILLSAGVLAAAGLESSPGPALPVPGHGPVPVLMYHRTTDRPNYSIDISPQRLEAQLRELARGGYTSISMRLWAASQFDPSLLPDSPVVITFDDGWQGQYRYAAPLLEQYGFTGTFYLYTSVLRGDSSPGGVFMSWREAGDLVARGHEIGGHTQTHPNLNRLRPAALAREVAAGKVALEKRLGIVITTFAYPYGACNDNVVAAVTAAGYQTAVSTVSGVNTVQFADPYRVRRLAVGHRTPARQLLAALTAPEIVLAAGAPALQPAAFATGLVDRSILFAAR